MALYDIPIDQQADRDQCIRPTDSEEVDHPRDLPEIFRQYDTVYFRNDLMKLTGPIWFQRVSVDTTAKASYLRALLISFRQEIGRVHLP